MEASAKDGEGAGRGPCGLRNSELGPRPHEVLLASKKTFGGHSRTIIPIYTVLFALFRLQLRQTQLFPKSFYSFKLCNRKHLDCPALRFRISALSSARLFRLVILPP